MDRRSNGPNRSTKDGRLEVGGWRLEAAARAFLSSKGADSEFQPVQITDDAMDRMARAMGCPVEAMTFEPYPA